MMGLYLCVLDDEGEEVDGVEIGSYSDWAAFVQAIIALEDGGRGARFPLLTLHSDCDGEWSVEECGRLARDLIEIAGALKQSRPVPPTPGTWQANVARRLGLQFETLYDCFIDVDGESVIERLKGLADLAQRVGRPVLFQ
jgi:hypothetical protein